MRVFTRLAAAAALCVALTACNLATLQATFSTDVSAIEAKIAAIISKIRAAAPVVASDIQTGITLACSVVPLVTQQAANIQANISSPSATAQKALSDAAVAGATAQAACDQYNATQTVSPTASTTGNTLLAIWNSYIAGKTALNKALAAPAT